MNPTVASSTTWNNPNNAKVLDSTTSILNAGAVNSWLILKTFVDRAIPDDTEIVGIVVRVYTVDGLSVVDPGIGIGFRRLQIGLTVNGSTTVGTLKDMDAFTSFVDLGGVTDTWGRTWTFGEIQDANFGVMIRRGDVLGSEDTSTARSVGAVVVTVYYNYEGGSLTMPQERLQGAQRYVFAPETTLGTAVTPTTMLKHSYLDLYTKPEYQDITTFGQMLSADRVMTYALAMGDLKASAVDFNEIVFWLAARFGKPVATNLATGVYRLEFDIDPRKIMPKWSKTCQYGDFNIGEQYTYTMLRQMGLSWTKKQVTLSGQGIAQAGTDLRNGGDTDSKGIMGGVNCVQTLTISGVPTGGTFKLRYKGAETATIAYNAANTVVQSALEALTTIGAGNVAVVGSAGGPWTVTFQAAMAGRECDILELSLNSFTGGTAPTVTIAMTTKGGWIEYATAPMVAGKSTVYMATVYANLAAGKITELKEFGWESGDNLDPDDTFDNTSLTFASLTEKPTTIAVTLGVQADSNAQTMRKDTRSQVSKFARIENISDQIVGSAIPYSMTIDMFGKLRDLGELTAMGQKIGNRFGFDVFYDPTWGRAAKIVVVCAVPGTAF